MSLFSKLFGKKPNQEAVFVHLDNANLAEEVYEDYDLSTIEDQLIEILADRKLGIFDGNQVGKAGATLYLYGPDAERLFAGIEQTLREYPLCQGARVIIRRGGEGAPDREVRL